MYILHIAIGYCVPIALVLTHSVLVVGTQSHLLYPTLWGASPLCYITDWFWYISLTVQCWLCAHLILACGSKWLPRNKVPHKVLRI